jgi:hypothetical protein
MTISMKQFGPCLVTRKAAKSALQAIGVVDVTDILDFAGVLVANHCFADEFWKGIALQHSASTLAGIKLVGGNDYVNNSLSAGLSTAVSSPL